MTNNIKVTLFFSVRLVSDVVQYNFRMEQSNQKEFMYENINDIVLNKVKTRKFYQKRSKIFVVNIFYGNGNDSIMILKLIDQI